MKKLLASMILLSSISAHAFSVNGTMFLGASKEQQWAYTAAVMDSSKEPACSSTDVTNAAVSDIVVKGLKENPSLMDQNVSVSVLYFVQKMFPCHK